MQLFLLLAQSIFVIIMLGLCFLYLCAFALSWARAQSMAPKTSFLEVVTIAAIEWGAWISISAAHLRISRSYNAAPPYRVGEPQYPRQIPIVLVPSLHSSSRIFNMMSWRLRKNFYTNIWIFSWKSFLKDEVLLRQTLDQYLCNILEETKTRELHLVSFGSSRPVISRLLMDEKWRDIRVQWVAISSPAILSETLNFISTDRLQTIFNSGQAEQRAPDLLIRGSHDFFCYPDTVWGETKDDIKSVIIDPMGHYSTLLHSTTLKTILDFFESKYGYSVRHG